MDWLKSLAGGMWDAIDGLVALALLAVIGVPVGLWFWGWLTADMTHAVGFVALILAGGWFRNHAHQHNSA